MKIKDSGTRRQFETGAVRDMQEGKGRMDLLPWCALLRAARHFEAGAIKYGDRNWERGIPLSSFCDSAARHLAKFMDGQTDEDHLCAAAWNLLCALWTEEKRPDLINIPSRPEYAGGAQYGREDEMVELSGHTFEIDEEEAKGLMKPADWPKVNPWLQEPEEIYAGMYAEAKNEDDQELDAHYWRTAYREHLAAEIIRAMPEPDGFSRALVHYADNSILVTKANGWPLEADDQDQVLKVVAEFTKQVEHPELMPLVEFSTIKTD